MAITLNGSTGIDTPAIETDSLVIPTQVINGITVGKGGGNGNNTTVGYQALATNSTGNAITAIGYQALNLNTANNITAVGYKALATNSTGTLNTGIGGFSLYSTTTGGSNTALGWASLYTNTTGASNVAIGDSALQANTTASNNTAVGYKAGYANTTAIQNNFFGAFAGYSVTTGNRNTFIGSYGGYSVTTGAGNTFVGNAGSNNSVGAGYYMTTGNDNTIIGGFTGQSGSFDIRTASNYIVLSDGLGNPRAVINPSGAINIGEPNGIGAGSSISQNLSNDWALIVRNSNNSLPNGLFINYNNAAPNNTARDFIYASDSSTVRFSVRSNGGIQNYQANDSNLSDAREKTNVELAGSYLDKICAIPVKTFNYIDQNREEDDGLTLGVIAQDVQAVAPELVLESNWASKDQPEKMRLSIYQTDLQYALMKCIQELKATVDLQSTEIASLKQQINNGV